MTDTNKPRLLIVDDDAEIVRLLKAVLASLNLELSTATTVRQVLQFLDERVPEIMLLDMRLPDGEGLDVVAEVRRRGAPCTVIAMTAHGTLDVAVEAMRQGAHDFLTKPLDYERLKIIVGHALERHRLIAQLDDFLSSTERLRFRYLHGSSPAMQRLYRSIQGCAKGRAPVMITGPNGVEWLETAKTLHGESGDPEVLFRTVDLAALPDEAARHAAIFGSGGDKGLLHAASGGTVFIQNVSLLGDGAQADLESWIMQGSGDQPRLITAAPEVFLQQDQPAGFRPTLLALLSGVLLRLTPLSQRADDVLELAQLFLEQEADRLQKPVRRMTDEVEEALMLYDWPGNVEELRTVVFQAVDQSRALALTLEHLPPALVEAQSKAHKTAGTSGGNRSEARAVIRPLWQTERDEIEKALKLCDGSVLEAGRLLEVSPGTIYRKQRLWQSNKR